MTIRSAVAFLAWFVFVWNSLGDGTVYFRELPFAWYMAAKSLYRPFTEACGFLQGAPGSQKEDQRPCCTIPAGQGLGRTVHRLI